MRRTVRAWVGMLQALRAVEAVNRFWAESLGLVPEDVLLLLVLAKEDHTPTSLGIAAGRQRQQVHRSLMRFEREHLVEAAAFARRGRVSHWRLTSHGKRMVECLHRRLDLWEAHLDGRVNVDALLDELGAVLRTLVNRRVEGYFAGLYVPREWRNDPNLEFAQEAEELKAAHEALARTPPPRHVREQLARQHAEATRKAEAEAAQRAWARLWN